MNMPVGMEIIYLGAVFNKQEVICQALFFFWFQFTVLHCALVCFGLQLRYACSLSTSCTRKGLMQRKECYMSRNLGNSQK